MSVKTKPSSSSQEHPKKILTREHGKSMFHVPMPPPSCTECMDGLESVGRFTDNLKQLCGAGTHAAHKISSLLVGTSYQEIAGQFLVLQQHLDGAMDSVVSQIKTELDSCVKRLGRDDVDNCAKGDNDVMGPSHKPEDLQVLAMGLVLMLQLQQQFFITATEKLACFSQSHALNNTNGLTLDAKFLPASLHANNQRISPSQLGHQVAARAASDPEHHGRQSPNKGSSDLDPSNACLDSTDTKPQGGTWQSDDSKGDREAGSSQNGSKFASSNEVKMQSAGQMIGQCAQLQGQGHMTAAPPNPSIHLPNGRNLNSTAKVTGSVVSEEEINFVIDMLSRATKYSAPTGGHPAELAAKPPTIHPNQSAVGLQPAVAAISKAPGSHLPANSQYVLTALPAGAKEQLGCYGNRAAQHRQSDGFIGEPHMNAETKTNTWPFRPRQKEGRPTWQGVDYTQSSLYNPHGAYDAMGYPEVMYSLPPGGSAKPPLIPCFNPGPWGTAPDGSTNKAWPVFPNIGDGEGAPRQWSAMADSSSCSDESSSNSEVHWMMGVNLMEAMNMKRRHSSGGEEIAGTAGGPTNNINKSVDSLMEPKLTNTWPPKHPWNSKGNDELSGGDTCDGVIKGVHRPLMPQWSDPVTAKPLAVWDTGLTGSLSQQSFGSMSTGGAAYIAVQAQEDEKRF